MISAVVCVKNREDNLLTAIESWLDLKDINEIIILDWGSDKPIFVENHIVKIYRTEQQFWHMTRAYNVVIQLAKHNKILKLDADYVLHSNFFDQCNLEPGIFFSGQSQKAKIHCQGIFFFYRKDFLKCNGFNERNNTWSYDDTDFYFRMCNMGLKHYAINFDNMHHLSHDDNSRIMYTKFPGRSSRLHYCTQYNKEMTEKNPWTVKDKMTTWESLV